MFYNYLTEFLENCYQELMHAPDQEIQDALKDIQKNVPTQEFEPMMKHFIKGALDFTSDENLSEADFDEFFINNLKSFAQHTLNLTKSIVFKATLNGFEHEVYRVIEMPYTSTLADVAYAILGSCEATGHHLYSMKYKKGMYYCSRDDEFEDFENNTSLVLLSELGLRKGSKLKLNYDFGDDYQFDIQVKAIKSNDHSFRMNDMIMTEGKGYGLWEDEHYEMDLFYHDRPHFDLFLKENGLEEDMFPCEETFDLDVANEELICNYLFIKNIYEGNFDDDDFDLDDYDLDDMDLDPNDLPF